jgi:hypothetical protein
VRADRGRRPRKPPDGCARYLDSPYAQLFCGETFFQHALPLDRSSMTRWRRRIGPERLELLLAESLAAAQRGGAVEERHLRRVTIDTTVQPKAVTHPTDSKLLQRGIEILAQLARRNGVRLRQSYLRVARKARREAAKLIHSGRPRQAERQVRRLRTWLGRLFRDIGRKIAGNAAAESAFAGPLGLIARLLRQRREDRGRDKLYSLHAPEVECIGKGKAQARFEFGVKVSLAPPPTRPRPAGSSFSARAPCPATPMTATPWQQGSPRPSASPASRSSAPTSTGAIAATTPTATASSSPARSAASLPPSAANGDAATPSSPSSDT